MEAIDSGLLPILYNIPAYDYVCSNDIKLKPGDITLLAAKIIYFLENVSERQKIVRRLQVCNGKYSVEYVFNRWIRQIRSHTDIN